VKRCIGKGGDQCCGSGLNPDSNRRLDPDPDSVSGPGSSKGIIAVLKPTKVITFCKFNQIMSKGLYMFQFKKKSTLVHAF
jgi:hypothetical protein